MVYVLYELLKGESSFYAPYLNHCQLDDLPPLWEETQSWDRLEDGVLKTKLKLTRDQVLKDWLDIQNLFKGHSEDFFKA